MKMYTTIEEVAQSLRVTVPTIRWLRQEGRFAPAIKVGRRVLWDEEALSRLGLRRTEKRRPSEYPTEGHAERQGPLPGASKRMAGRSLLGCSTASLMRWRGSRINGDSCGRVSGWTRVEARVPLSVVAERWLESRRTVKGGHWKATAGRGGTTSLRGSGVGQWHRSLRQTSRAGLVT